MGSFVNNWHRHRNQLIDQLHGVEGTIRSAMATFKEGDHKIAAVLTTSGSTSSQGPE